MKISHIYLLIFASCGIFCHISNCQAVLNATRQLISRFERKLDSNIYYHFQHKQQHKHHNMCSSSQLGPFCAFLNNNTLGPKDTHDSQARQAVMLSLMPTVLGKIEELNQFKKTHKDQYVFFPSQPERKDLDLIYEHPGSFLRFKFIQKVLFFEFFEPEKDRSTLITQQLMVNAKGKLHLGNVIPPEPNSGDQYIRFEGLWVPSRNDMIGGGKQQIIENDEENENDDTKSKPKKTFIFTQKQAQGQVHFLHPMLVKSFYTRRHDFKYYHSNKYLQQKYVLKSEEVVAMGYLKGQRVVDYTIQEKRNDGSFDYNEWVFASGKPQYKPKMATEKRDENDDSSQFEFALIDELKLMENLDIDNLSFVFKFLIYPSQFEKTQLANYQYPALWSVNNGETQNQQLFKDKIELIKQFLLENDLTPFDSNVEMVFGDNEIVEMLFSKRNDADSDKQLDKIDQKNYQEKNILNRIRNQKKQLLDSSSTSSELPKTMKTEEVIGLLERFKEKAAQGEEINDEEVLSKLLLEMSSFLLTEKISAFSQADVREMHETAEIVNEYLQNKNLQDGIDDDDDQFRQQNGQQSEKKRKKAALNY